MKLIFTTSMLMQGEYCPTSFRSPADGVGRSSTGDSDARRSGIVQLINYIEANSAGRAVILGGDFNDRWTNSALSINLLTGEGGFTDSWVQLIKGGVYPTPGSAANGCSVPAADNQCEVVDKVL